MQVMKMLEKNKKVELQKTFKKLYDAIDIAE